MISRNYEKRKRKFCKISHDPSPAHLTRDEIRLILLRRRCAPSPACGSLKRGRAGQGVKAQSKGAKLQARERGSILSASSWPGSSRPSTSWQIERKAWMPGSSPGMTSLRDNSSRAENPRLTLRELAARLVFRRYRTRFNRSGSALPPPEKSLAEGGWGGGMKLRAL